MSKTKVYTRTGDGGQTSLVGGIRISKASIRLEAYGTVDELSSNLGLLIALLHHEQKDTGSEALFEEDISVLLRIQNLLFNVGAHLATDQENTPLKDSGQLDAGAIAFLEHQIDAINGSLPELTGFILPGGTSAAAQAHVCRTICRRAERCIVALAQTAQVDENIQRFVNRLSDYLFVLARKINFRMGNDEILWKNACI